jgi:tryptophan-rich sensory protein
MDFLDLLYFGPAWLVQFFPAAVFLLGITLILSQGALVWYRGEKRPFFRLPPVLAGLLWIIFGLYELQLQARVNSAAVPMRMDLFFLLPILYVLTAVAITSLFRQLWTHGKTAKDALGAAQKKDTP